MTGGRAEIHEGCAACGKWGEEGQQAVLGHPVYHYEVFTIHTGMWYDHYYHSPAQLIER
jgi:hypothetical protein